MIRSSNTQRFPTLKHLAATSPHDGGIYAAQVSLSTSGRTHKGTVRSKNEDHFVIADLERGFSLRDSSFEVSAGWRRSRRQATLLMVADGVGGHAHGEVASAVALDAVLDYLSSMLPWLPFPDEEGRLEPAFREAVRLAQERLFIIANRKKLTFRPGTTLTVAYVQWPVLYVAHAGDTRCYLVRSDEGIRQLTKDHTMAAQLVDAGLSKDTIQHSRLSNVLTNAVGGGSPDLQIDCDRFDLKPGDRLLLCSDGLTSVIADAELEATVNQTETAKGAVDRLIETALNRNVTDNVTAVVAHVQSN